MTTYIASNYRDIDNMSISVKGKNTKYLAIYRPDTERNLSKIPS